MRNKMKTFEFDFKNGKVIIEPLRYDRYLTVKLTNDVDGSKRIFHLEQRIFLTVKHAKFYAFNLLKKFDLL